MIRVVINAESRYPVARRKLREEVVDFLEGAGVTEASNIEVEINFVGARKMKKLNKEFLNKNEATDVLSFGMEEGEGKKKFIEPKQKFLHLGSVAVCYPRAQEQANERNVMVDEEVGELVKHGLKHLLGIHHD